MIERGDAERLDAADPLAPFRERFVLGDPETLYLDGNSLGRLPLATRQALHERIDQWGAQLVAGWHEWIDIPQRAGDVLAEAVLGARPGEVIVADSTTVNLYKLASAVLTRREGAIITDRGNFPTDRYVLEGLARRHGRELILFDADPLTGPQAADIAHASAGDIRMTVRDSAAHNEDLILLLKSRAQKIIPESRAVVIPISRITS